MEPGIFLGVFFDNTDHSRRHGRACPGHPRLCCGMKDVDARHKAGHDERETEST